MLPYKRNHQPLDIHWRIILKLKTILAISALVRTNYLNEPLRFVCCSEVCYYKSKQHPRSIPKNYSFPVQHLYFFFASLRRLLFCWWRNSLKASFLDRKTTKACISFKWRFRLTGNLCSLWYFTHELVVRHIYVRQKGEGPKSTRNCPWELVAW